MRNRLQLAGIVIAMALLVVGFPAIAAAQTQAEGGPQVGGPQREYVPVPMVMLTGMLKSDGADGYMLVDQQSGDSIDLKKKSKKLAKHEGQMVTIEGRWVDNDPTSKTFKVSKVEPAPEAAAETQATHAESPAPATPETAAEEAAAPDSPEAPAPEAPAPESPEIPDPELPQTR
jgi:hypothetical protein